MGDTKEAVQVLKRLLRQENSVTMKQAKDCLAILQHEATVNGLADDDLFLCSKFVLRKCKTICLTQALLKCMVPKHIVPTPVVKNVLKWIYINRDLNVKKAVFYALQWVAGLLEFDLVDEKPVSDYYYLFLSFLKLPILEHVACWLVVRLTKPEDVNRSLVVMLLYNDLREKPRIRNIILWCFKTFKPECVPETVATHSVLSTLKLTGFYKEYFAKARQRLAAAGLMHLKQDEYDVTWKVREKGKQPFSEFLSSVDYVHFGSQLYREKEISVLQITTWKHFSKHMLQIGLPCNILCLLQNPIGFYILACGNDLIQQRLSYTLLHTLQNVIIDCLVEVPLREQEHLLDKICDFQEYMQQGIPIMSRFLATYIAFWDGITFLPQLMRLLPWVTYSSFSELKQIFLVHLYYVYISSNVMVKSSILRSLMELVHNLTRQIYDNESKLFLHSPKLDNGKELLYDLIQFTEYFCKLGLYFEPDSVLMISEVLRLYELLVDIENMTCLHVYLPPVVTYFSLFSGNVTNIERVCNLLLKYEASIIMQKSQKIEIAPRAKLIKKYSSDFVNILWCDQAFSERESGFIFKHLPPTAVEKISKQIDINKTFSLRNNIPCFVVSKDETSDDKEAFRNFMQLLKHFLPNIYNFLKQNIRRREKHKI